MQKYWSLSSSSMMFALKKPSNFWVTSNSIKNNRFSSNYVKVYVNVSYTWVNKWWCQIIVYPKSKTKLLRKRNINLRKWLISRKQRSKELTNTLNVLKKGLSEWSKNKIKKEKNTNKNRQKWSNRSSIWNKKTRNALKFWLNIARIRLVCLAQLSTLKETTSKAISPLRSN